jgi:hypothetical protein
MATLEQRSRPPRQASFRHVASGAVVNTGCFHDITCLGSDDVDLDEWEAGFTDSDGRFYSREEAARAVGLRGRLEAESYFAGEENPTLEAGRLEAWRKEGLRAAA